MHCMQVMPQLYIFKKIHEKQSQTTKPPGRNAGVDTVKDAKSKPPLGCCLFFSPFTSEVPCFDLRDKMTLGRPVILCFLCEWLSHEASGLL